MRDFIFNEIKIELKKLSKGYGVGVDVYPDKFNRRIFYVSLTHSGYVVKEAFDKSLMGDCQPRKIAGDLLSWLFSDYFKSKAKINEKTTITTR